MQGKMRQIIEVGRRLYQSGMVAANDGNISLRHGEGMLITRSGVSKGFMEEADILYTDMQGNTLRDDALRGNVSRDEVPRDNVSRDNVSPSSEIKMHIAAYNLRADVQAICHAHPPKATAFAVARIPFGPPALSEMVLTIGEVALADYATPSTQEVARAVEAHIGRCNALLLANHGVLCVGNTLEQAHFRMEAMEHTASILLYARLLGGEVPLTDAQVAALHAIREKMR